MHGVSVETDLELTGIAFKPGRIAPDGMRATVRSLEDVCRERGRTILKRGAGIRAAFRRRDRSGAPGG